MSVRIVTDSASDLDAEAAAALGIEIVPLSIRFGDEEFVDRQDLSVSEFYQKMESSEHFPETAAPSPGAFEAAFRKCVAEGANEVVSINLSDALSATGQSARNAAKAVADDFAVTVIDSQSITAGLGTLAMKAAEAARAGATTAEIVTLVEGLRERTHVFGVLDTLENLKKGGRIGSAKAMIGTMLSFKPCLDLSSGETVEAGRQRTRKKAVAWLRTVLEEAGPIEDLAVIHGDAPDVEAFLDLIADLHPRDQIRVEQLGAVIGTHGGPRVLGVTYLAAP